MTLFKGKIRKGNLYPFYRGVNIIVDECKVNIGPRGMFIDEIDPANVCRVSAKLPIEIFELNSYELTTPQESVIIGVDLVKYSEIIHNDIDEDTIFEFKLIEPQNEHRNPRLITQINRTAYKHTTLDPATIRRTQRELNFFNSIHLTVPYTFFKDGIEAVEKNKDDEVLIGVDFTKNNPILFMRSNNEDNLLYDNDCVNTEIELTDLPKWHCEKDKQDSVIQSLFSMDYMSDIVKGLYAFRDISSDNILLKLHNDVPIQISLKNELAGAELNYILAPRIE